MYNIEGVLYIYILCRNENNAKKKFWWNSSIFISPPPSKACFPLPTVHRLQTGGHFLHSFFSLDGSSIILVIKERDHFSIRFNMQLREKKKTRFFSRLNGLRKLYKMFVGFSMFCSENRVPQNPILIVGHDSIIWPIFGCFHKWGYPKSWRVSFSIWENPNLTWMMTRGSPMTWETSISVEVELSNFSDTPQFRWNP